MSEPKRYIFRIRECGCVKPEHLEGKYAPSALIIEETEEKCGWVRYEDYARLKVEVERLTNAGDALSMRYDTAWTLINVQTNYIERLTKAGDEMAMTLHYEGSGSALEDWNKVKGVQS
jgi:hypothetical protein